MNQEKKSEIKKTSRTTLKELGPRMCIGTCSSDGSYIKDFSVKRWRMKEERELGELRDKSRGENVGQFVSRILSHMCTEIGLHKLETMEEPERLLKISQLFIGDVFYIYVWLRTKSLGKDLSLNVRCSNCNDKFKFIANLDTLEVDVCETYEDSMWNYVLESPFSIRGKEVKSFTFGPPRWTTLENLKGIGSMNTGAAKAGMIHGSIVGINEEKDSEGKIQRVMLAPSELDEMEKIDIERITELMDINAIGPNMTIEGECPKCHSNFIVPINWTYDNFFESSSR